MRMCDTRRGKFRIPILFPVAALFLSAFFSTPAAAWNAAGHRIIAVIAWQQLDAQTQHAVDALLARHPDAERWRRKNSDPATSPLLMLASTWPDDIKHDPRFYDPGEPPTPTLPEFPDMLRHRDWHYADRPDDGNCAAHGELERQLAALGEISLDAGQDPALRAYALSWTIHLLGDAHQPLHAGTRCDRGGNMLSFATPFHPRFERLSLHAFWDDLPGPPWLSGAALEETAQRWQREIPPPTGATMREWLEESRNLTREMVYEGLSVEPENLAEPDGDGRTREPTPLSELSADYRERAHKIARRRIVHAGYRLAEWLRAVTARK